MVLRLEMLEGGWSGKSNSKHSFLDPGASEIPSPGHVRLGWPVLSGLCWKSFQTHLYVDLAIRPVETE